MWPRTKELRNMAERHWKEFCPRLVRELQAKGKLEEALDNAALSTAKAERRIKEQLMEQNPPPESGEFWENLRYHTWIKNTARELVRQEWILLPAEEDL
ncbi:MAG: hypothetical protein QME76_02065 [Bacillota bacterium]|nr:hypothetical protein [Bacillota bacterium]